MATVTLNGCEYYYEMFGDGPETILFAHGLLMTHEAFREQIDYFKSKYRIVVLDHRGHGQTQVTQNGYELDSLTNDISDLIEALGLGQVHYVGHSMGGFIGLRLAARRPELVKSLLLINTSAEADAHMFRNKLLMLLTQLFGVKLVAKQVHKMNFGKKFLTDPNRRITSQFWLKHLYSLPKTILNAAHPVLYRSSVVSELDKINCPTFIIGGTDDIILSPKNAELLHQKINNSQLSILENIGHCAAIEAPETVNPLMEEFLQKQTP